MPINVANYFGSDRRSAKAGEAITLGMVVKISDDGTGFRKALKLLDADSAFLVGGLYGVAYKVSVDPNQVGSTSTAPASTGDRTISIASGDYMVEVSRFAVIEYSPDLLHASLDPARSGATPVAGQVLAIKSSQWCTAATASAITSPIVGRVFRVHATKVLIELV